MKRLTLMRHGEARWQDAGLSDLERPLSRRGTATARSMARRLAELTLVPDLLLASPARRTQQTADIVARELALSRVVREEKLYLAAAPELLAIAQATAPRIGHLLLVGHNPGVTELMQLLVPAQAGSGLGTAALCSISFACETWGELGAAQVREVRREDPPPARFFGLFG
ncbi:MAG: histidine phosphatase family protein [Gammaproteobacteria bacterium]|nr:histidine phosphatase family protein [Gammaproteobacteria bacterium]MBV9619390.1 histidine phosphatase family protein [Gammaproteobacteria bacterium]